MNQETLSFLNWQLQRAEVEEINEALKRADSGHLVEHSKLKEMVAKWCKIEQARRTKLLLLRTNTRESIGLMQL